MPSDRAPLSIAMLIARYPPVVGGAENQCQRLSLALARRGHQITVLTESTDGRFSEQFEAEHLRVIRFATWGKPPISSAVYALQAFRRLRNMRDLSLYHAHLLSAPAVVAATAGALFHKPALLKVAGARKTGDVGTSQLTLRGRLKLNLLRRCQPYWVVPSAETETEILTLGVPRERTAQISNGIETTFFTPGSFETRNELRQKFGFHADDCVLIYAGRWAKGKGVEDVIARAHEAGSSRLRLLLILPESPSAEQQHHLSPLKERVQIVVRPKDLIPYYQAGDAAVLLSQGEGLSNFLLEAMACALPILTTEAARVALDQEKFGWVVKTPEQAARALNDCAANSAERSAKGAEARRYVKARFAMDLIAAQYEALYARMLGRAA